MVSRWLNYVCPALAARGKEEDAEINLGGETGVEENGYTGKIFVPRGCKPVLHLSGNLKVYHS